MASILKITSIKSIDTIIVKAVMQVSCSCNLIEFDLVYIFAFHGLMASIYIYTCAPAPCINSRTGKLKKQKCVLTTPICSPLSYSTYTKTE